MNIGGFAVVFFLTGGVLLVTAIVAWRLVDSPAVNLFAVVAGLAGAGGLCLGFGFATQRYFLILGTTIAVALLVPVPWAVFAFDYVGQESLVSTWVTGLLSVPVLTALSATLALYVGAAVPEFTLGTRAEMSGSLSILVTVLQLLQWGGLLYTGGLVIVGAGLILWMFRRYPHLNGVTGTALCTFGVIPWLAILFSLQLEPVSFLGFGTVLAAGYLFQTAAAVALIGPPGLFARVPTASSIGPATIIEELDDPVVVTDSDGRVLELNPAARRAFDWPERSTGSTLEGALGTSLSALRDRQVVELESDTGRVLFEPTVSVVKDRHRHMLGHAVVFRDVTDRRTRQQRLEVLNRILRHNLRNDLSIIIGYASIVRDRVEDPTALDGLDRITTTADDLADISKRARQSAQLLDSEADYDDQTRLGPLLRSLCTELQSAYDGELSYEENAPVAVPVRPSQLEVVFRSLLERILEHNDAETPVVELRGEYDPQQRYPLRISITGNGSGVPEPDREVIETGTETPLEHTSGVGLWTARWLTTAVGGDISFGDADAEQSTVILSFPAATALPADTRSG